MGVSGLIMATMPPSKAPVKRPNKCSYTAPSDSDSETEDECPEDTLLPNETNAHDAFTNSQWSTNQSKHPKTISNPIALLHMISDDRDLWVTASQEDKRQTWV